MDIGTLKLAIKDLPDEMLVGNSGHYGEYLEVYDARKGKVSKSWNNSKMMDLFIINIEEAGEEPY